MDRDIQNMGRAKLEERGGGKLCATPMDSHRGLDMIKQKSEGGAVAGQANGQWWGEKRGLPS